MINQTRVNCITMVLLHTNSNSLAVIISTMNGPVEAKAFGRSYVDCPSMHVVFRNKSSRKNGFRRDFAYKFRCTREMGIIYHNKTDDTSFGHRLLMKISFENEEIKKSRVAFKIVSMAHH